MSDKGISTERARSHFTVNESDGGLYVPKVHHPSGPGFTEPLEVDDDWDDGDDGPVDDPDPGYNGHGDKRAEPKK